MRERNCGNCKHGQWPSNPHRCSLCVAYDKWQEIRVIRNCDNCRYGTTGDVMREGIKERICKDCSHGAKWKPIAKKYRKEE